MEPLAIVASCATLGFTVARCIQSITVFVREVRDARGDLDMIARELQSLDTVIACLKDDVAKPSSNTLPPNLATHLESTLRSCDAVVEEIVKSLAKHKSSRLGRGGHWTLGGGKDDMTKFRISLENHKSALDLALDMITMNTARDIKKDTTEICQYAAIVPEIKNDTEKIWEEIRRLRAQLREGGPNIVLERFLDESTTYAETVVNDDMFSEPGDPPYPTSPPATYRAYQPPAASTDFAYYPHGRDAATSRNHARHASGPELTTQGGLTPTRDLMPSPLSYRSKHRTVDQSDSSSELSRLSLGTEKDFEKSRVSLTTSRVKAPSTRSASRGVSNSQQFRDAPDQASLGPSTPVDFQNHLRRPDDWKILTLNHRTQSGSQSLSSSEFWTHRYTAMTRGPSYLAHVDFKLRQQLDPPRETMLLICVHYPSTFADDEFSPRVATTLESIAEAIAATKDECRLTNNLPWWTTVVVLLVNTSNAAQSQYALTGNGTRLRCDVGSEHCGISPDEIPDDDRKIYAHLWEHTSPYTKISWNRKGIPESFEDGGTPLQLIQCQYTARAGPNFDLAGAEHLSPFIRMLSARSCVIITAGDKISKYELFNAYMTARNSLSTIWTDDTMLHYPGNSFEFSFQEQMGGVPAKVYPQEKASKFKQEKRSLYTRFGSIF